MHPTEWLSILNPAHLCSQQSNKLVRPRACSGARYGGLDLQSLSYRRSAQPPIITSRPTLVGCADTLYVYRVLAQDAEHDALTFSLNSAPWNDHKCRHRAAWFGRTWVVGVDWPITLLVTDGGQASQSPRSHSGAAPDNYPQITSLPPTSGSSVRPFLYAVQANDADGDPLSYSLANNPSGMAISPRPDNLAHKRPFRGTYTAR